jgi:hypothetical protein
MLNIGRTRVCGLQSNRWAKGRGKAWQLAAIEFWPGPHRAAGDSPSLSESLVLHSNGPYYLVGPEKVYIAGAFLISDAVGQVSHPMG